MKINGKAVTEKQRLNFFSKLEKKGDCLEFQGAKKPVDGYGWIGLNGTQLHAHRLAYILEYGEIASSKILVCHKCDNPPCCNPEHLFLGSDFDNMQDMIKKGRKASIKGEIHPNSILKEKDVKHIFNSEKSAKDLAAEYGVSKFTIYDVRSRKSWRHLSL